MPVRQNRKDKPMERRPSYNKYVTDGIQDGSIQSKEIDGCTVYLVRRPNPDEEVIEYTSFSGMCIDKTLTQQAEWEGQE